VTPSKNDRGLPYTKRWRADALKGKTLGKKSLCSGSSTGRRKKAWEGSSLEREAEREEALELQGDEKLSRGRIFRKGGGKKKKLLLLEGCLDLTQREKKIIKVEVLRGNF